MEAQQQQQQRKRSLAPQVLTELPLSLRPGTLRGTSPTLAPFTTQLWYLSMRELRYLYRNVPALIARFAVTGIMSLIAGILFQNSCALPPAPGPQATPEELSAYQFRLQAYCT